MSNHVTYGIVYVVTCTVNGKQYVGQTTQTLAKRWRGHTASSKCHHSALWNAIQKYGAASFTLATVDSGTDKGDLDAKETEWVSKLGTMAPAGYNLTSGGGSRGKYTPEARERNRQAQLGKKLSDATKEKIRQFFLGKPQDMEFAARRAEAMRATYANLPDESRERISKANLGKVRSDETRKRLSESHKGKVLPPEVRAKMAASRVGHPVSLETRAKLRAAALSRKTSVKESNVPA